MLINTIFKILNLRLINRFEKNFNNPQKFQEDLLFRILKQNQNCEYGIKYNFGKIKSIKDFQSQAPIIKYEDIANDIERMKSGEQNILTNQKILYFATTSGSTGTPKFIPITEKRLKNFKDEYTLWAVFAMRDCPRLIKGKSLLLTGSNYDGETKSGIPYGSISGYLATKLPWYVKTKLVVPLEVYNIKNFNEKIRKIAKIGLEANISQLGLSSSVEAILLFEYLRQNKDQLIKEIVSDGNIKRGQELMRVKNFIPKNYWPNLVLLNYIKGGFSKFYLEKVQNIVGPDVEIRDPGIYSSEGRISICLSGKDARGVIAVNSNFFEFMKIVDDKLGNPVTINNIELGKSYAVLLTTQEGLYRYDIGDIVRVVDFYKKTPVVEFVNRKEISLSIVGEHVTEKELVDSVQEAVKKQDVKLFSFTVIPNLDAIKPRYEFLIEPLDFSFDEKKIKNLLKDIDNELIERNFVYKKMRFDYGRMDAPIISVLDIGSYNKLDVERIKRNGVKQIKPINLSQDPDFKKNFKIAATYSL